MPRSIRPPAAAAVADVDRLRELDATGLLDALPSAAFDRLARMAQRATRSSSAVVSVVGGDRRVLLGAHDLRGPWASRRETTLDGSFCLQVVERGGPVVLDDALEGSSAITRADLDLGGAAFAGMPLTTQAGHTLGSVTVVDDGPRRWSAEDLDALADVAASAMTEVELRRMAWRLAAEARTDALTGLGNRRTWEDEGAREVARAQRFGQPLVLALLDLHRFRRYNDRHGTTAGDELLREVAVAWRGSLRDVDVLLRLGGMQFALAMPATGLDSAFDVVERLRAGLGGGLTCAAGLAMLRDGESAADLLARADAALTRAKRSGRNASALAS